MIEIIAEIKLNGFIIENTCDLERMQDAFNSIHDLIDDAMEINENMVHHVQNFNTGTGYGSEWEIAGLKFCLIENQYGYGFIVESDDSDAILTEIVFDNGYQMDLTFKMKCEKLGILSEVINLIANCECGQIHNARIERLSNLRKWEIQEVIGNYLDAELYGSDFCLEGKHMKTFCKAFGIEEKDIPMYYAFAICEGGCEIAYRVNEDIILILE